MRTFIHVREHTALIVSLPEGIFDPARQRVLASALAAIEVAHPKLPDRILVWAEPFGLDEDDLLPSITALNTPEAPTWAEVDESLLVETLLGVGALDDGVVSQAVDAEVRDDGGLWLVGPTLEALLPADLMTPRCMPAVLPMAA